MRSRMASARVDDTGREADPVAVAREIALRQLTAKDRTREELARALARRNVPPDAARVVLDRLEEVGLVDDARYASGLVESVQRRPRSRAVVRKELSDRGVPAEIVEDAIAALDADTERDAALGLARKKAKAVSGLPRPVAFRRVSGALARRGFGSSVVMWATAQALDCDDAASDDAC